MVGGGGRGGLLLIKVSFLKEEFFSLVWDFKMIRS